MGSIIIHLEQAKTILCCRDAVHLNVLLRNINLSASLLCETFEVRKYPASNDIFVFFKIRRLHFIYKKEPLCSEKDGVRRYWRNMLDESTECPLQPRRAIL